MQINIVAGAPADIRRARPRGAAIAALLSLLVFPAAARAGFADLARPERVGLALTYGHSYDPEPTFGFTQLSGVFQYDYGRVWPNRAPKELRFKLEGNLGTAHYQGEERLFSSADMLAQYYLAPRGGGYLVPYAEAGIGLIYSDFRVENQGLRLNFNPQAGIGCDFGAGERRPYFAAFRIHHLSNGGLNHANRGINSVLLQVGRYF